VSNRGSGPRARAPNVYGPRVAKIAATERMSRLLQGGGHRTVTLTFDKRDTPPWSAELAIGGKLVGIRWASTLQEAITLVQELEPVPCFTCD
jgi:hypothetical protein